MGESLAVNPNQYVRYPELSFFERLKATYLQACVELSNSRPASWLLFGGFAVGATAEVTPLNENIQIGSGALSHERTQDIDGFAELVTNSFATGLTVGAATFILHAGAGTLTAASTKIFPNTLTIWSRRVEEVEEEVLEDRTSIHGSKAMLAGLGSTITIITNNFKDHERTFKDDFGFAMKAASFLAGVNITIGATASGLLRVADQTKAEPAADFVVDRLLDWKTYPVLFAAILAGRYGPAKLKQTRT